LIREIIKDNADSTDMSILLNEKRKEEGKKERNIEEHGVHWLPHHQALKMEKI
jgi:hypothetical protein